MPPQPGDRDWRSIAHQVSKEMEAAKLMILAGELCCDRRWAQRSPGSDVRRNEFNAFP